MWLCIHLNNDGEYCDITLKIMVMLQNVCENCSLSCEKRERNWLPLIDKPKREKPKTVRTPENIDAVAESMCEAPSTSIHRLSQQMNISKTSLKQILHKDLYV